MANKIKKNTYRAVLFALGLIMSNPGVAMARSKFDDLSFKDVLEIMFEGAEKAEEHINENYVNPTVKKMDDLWEHNVKDLIIVTDIPNVNPSEKRHYYFVNTKWIHGANTYYYNANMVKVKNGEIPRYKEFRKMYFSVTDFEVYYRTEEWTDLSNNKIFLNYEVWNENSVVYDENTTAKYITFNDITPFLKDEDIEKVQKTGYLSTYDLKRIEKYINSEQELDVEMVNIKEYEDNLKLIKKKK